MELYDEYFAKLKKLFVTVPGFKILSDDLKYSVKIQNDVVKEELLNLKKYFDSQPKMGAILDQLAETNE